MKKIALTLVFLLLLLVLALQFGTKRPTNPGPFTKNLAPAAATNGAPPAVTPAPGTAPTPATPVPAQPGLLPIHRPADHPKFTAFEEWVQRYRAAATDAERSALETEGVDLARARREVLAELIQSDPRRALGLALERHAREQLPGSVKAFLEEPVNARGDLEVMAFFPAAGQEAEIAPVLRYAVIEGQRHQVFTYGGGLRFITKAGVPVDGIRLPTSAAARAPAGNGLPPAPFLMALSESPARRLDAAEIAALKEAQQRAQQPGPVCGVSGKPWTVNGEETAVELAGTIHSFCGKVHAEDWASAHVAASGLDVPGGDVNVTSESSYTEGRKRMLCLRPFWTDYAGMTTNEALTHWVAFSNYMYQLSYGKLVFAPLGKGSAISTEIYLPGSVANYTAGLGAAPSTWGAVRSAAAAAPYNYVLGNYDFVYYCTKGQPAAGYAGLGFVGGVGFHLANSYFDAPTASHEFGHNLGLNHAHFWDSAAKSIIGTGQNVEYGDNNDPMGGGGNPNQYNSRYKNYLGWIADADVGNLNSLGSGQYRLYAFDLDNSVGLRGLKFTYSGSQNYWLNFRQRKTGKNSLMNGAQLLWTGNGGEGSYVLDVRLKGDADDNAIAIGRTFSDPARGYHVTPVGKGNTYPESLDVRVTVGSVPTNLPPTLTVASIPGNPAAAALVSFSATATDPNGDALAYFWEFGDGDYSVDNKAVTTHAFGAVGEYAVQCTASDMKGGATRRTVIVRVGNPSTFRITGRVLDQQNRPLSGIRVSTDTDKSVFTDSDGTYALVGLAAGSYSLDGAETLSGSLSFPHPFFNNPVTVGPDRAGVDFIGVPGSLNIYTPLAAKSSSWRYNDKGTDQGTAWRVNTFNDSGWSNGVAPLGYPSGAPIATVVSYGPDANNKYTTTYFRKSFVVPDPNVYTNLLLETLRDDGVIVYLNNTEIFRDNMPAGSVTYSTDALDSVEPDSYFQTTLSRTLLVPGTNYLAAEVHQVNGTSSDIGLDVGLSGLSVSNATGFNMVYISSPADQSTFSSPTNVTITATVLTGGTPATNVDFYVDGSKVGQATAAPYTFLLSNPADGSHSLRVVASIGALRSTSAPVTITVSAPATQFPPIALALIPTGTSWKYLTGGTAAPPAWTSSSFNDSSWPVGSAQLGYGDGDEATVISYGGNANNKWITYYFRRVFTVADAGAISNLSVRLKRDDGGIVYLNGVEVFRSNITNGPVNYLTLAFDAADDGAQFFGSSVDATLLQPGVNVVGVEIHQTTVTSSDVSFDLALDGLAWTNRPRGVYLTSPAEGAVLSGTVNFAADVVAGGSLGVTRVEFFADGLKVGQSTSIPYRLSWISAPGPHELTAVATDTASGSITSAPVNVTVTPPPVSTALISFGDVWKYLDTGTDPGPTWRNRVFNDSLWMAGPARLGYGGDGELTAVSYGTNSNNKYITTYFRKAFVVSNPAAYNGLLLRLVRDDGAVVYLNGVEIARNNLQAGLVSWNSLAVATVDTAAEQTPVDFVLPTTGLLAGTNELAVEIHQATAASSDLGFDLALLGLRDTNTALGIYFTTPANGTHFNLPANVALTAAATAAPDPVSLVEYYEAETKLGQATSHPYAFTWTGPPAGTHILTAVASYGAGLTMTSPPITVLVGPPPPPIIPVFTALLPPSTAPWKYWDNTTNAGIGWQTVSFADSAWPSASARFGWGLDGEMSPLTEGRVTHYFRRWFNVNNGGQLAELHLYLVRDDGAVVYLNGVEVFRSNMPGGPVDAATLASAAVNTPDETTWFPTVMDTAGSGLLSGSNLLAVELHQSSATSSDASFDFALYGQGTTERRVYLSSPRNNSSYQNSSVIPVEAQALAGAGLSVAKVELFADGNKIGESATPPYRLNWFGASFGAHVLFARMTDNLGGTLDSSSVTVNLTRELVTTTLILSNSVWKYFDGGVSQGTNWVNLNFNDSAWPSGPARLGFGGDGEVTPINGGPSNARFPTVYFRRKFVPPAGAVYTNLLFKLARDDGAVVHLNGREAYRDNMPPGSITYNSPAAANATDEQTFFPTNIAVTNLLAGTNILSVEVHQINATSSDLGFNLDLTASGYLEDTTPPLLAIELADGLVELSWSAMSSGWRVYAAPTVDTPSINWSPLPDVPVLVSGRYVVTLAPNLDERYFRLGRP